MGVNAQAKGKRKSCRSFLSEPHTALILNLGWFQKLNGHIFIHFYVNPIKSYSVNPTSVINVSAIPNIAPCYCIGYWDNQCLSICIRKIDRLFVLVIRTAFDGSSRLALLAIGGGVWAFLPYPIVPGPRIIYTHNNCSTVNFVGERQR